MLDQLKISQYRLDGFFLTAEIGIAVGDKWCIRGGRSYRIAYRLSYESSRAPFEDVFGKILAPS